MSKIPYGKVESDLLWVLIGRCNGSNFVKINRKEIVDELGYKNDGGSITTAIKTLQLREDIKVLTKDVYEVLI